MTRLGGSERSSAWNSGGFAIEQSAPDVSVIVVNWNTRALTINCVESLSAASVGLRTDVWVVDNASTDDSVAAIRARFPDANLIVNAENVGFGAAANCGIRASTGRYVCLMNSDTVARPVAIGQMVRFADGPAQAELVGPKLLNPDGSFQGSFSSLPSLWRELLAVTGLGKRLSFRDYPAHGPQHAQTACRVDCIAGPVMLVRRTALEGVGLFDEGYFMYSEEVDLCLRIGRAGGEVWFTPGAEVVHHGGQSTRLVRFAMLQALYRSRVRFFRKHHGPLQANALGLMYLLVLRARWAITRLQAWRDPDLIDPRIRWRDLQSR